MNGPTPEAPTPEAMRFHARQQLFIATELVALPIDSPLSQHCYCATRVETIAGGGDPDGEGQVFLLLQCDLDFTVVVPVNSAHPLSWCPWRNRLGRTRDGSRLHQHITRTSSEIVLREQSFPIPPRLDAHRDGNGETHPGWVNNFDLIAEGDTFHLFTNRADSPGGTTRKYFFGQNPEIWDCG